MIKYNNMIFGKDKVMDKTFEDVYNAYYKRIYYFLFRLTENHHLSEELTQETFFRAYQSLYRFREECDIFTWLVAIAKHVYYTYLKKNKLDINSISLSLIADTYFDETEATSEEAVQDEDIKNAAKKIISGLPKKYQDVLILRIYAGMTYEQIGKSLKITANSAKVIYFRAKKMLMEELEHENYL